MEEFRLDTEVAMEMIVLETQAVVEHVQLNHVRKMTLLPTLYVKWMEHINDVIKNMLLYSIFITIHSAF